MTTYEVGTNDRGDIGYVTCDEQALSIPRWQPYIDIGGDWIDLPTASTKRLAEARVRAYLESDGGA